MPFNFSDLIPQPQYQEQPIPLDETERINELNNQLTALDPKVRSKNYDFLGLNRRSKSIDLGNGRATTGRSKGDWLNIISNALTEGIKAAGGENNYVSPDDKARAQYVEDYKLQSPRIIDELKILNQNKRAYEADQSRERIQAEKNKLADRVANLRAKVDMIKSDQTRATAEDRIAVQREFNDLRRQGYMLPFEAQVTLGQIGGSLQKLHEDPNVAAQASGLVQNNAIQKALGVAAARAAVAPQINYNIIPKQDEVISPETGQRELLNKQSVVKGSTVNPVVQQILKNFIPNGQQGNQAPVTPGTQFFTPPPVVNKQLLPPVSQPQQPQQQQPLQPAPQPAAKPQAIAQAPVTRPAPVSNAPGAMTQKPDLSVIDPEAVKSDFYTKKDEVLAKRPLKAEDYFSPNSVEFKKVGNFVGSKGKELTENSIFGNSDFKYIATDDGQVKKVNKDGSQVILRPVFKGTRTERVQAQKDFQTFKDAAYALNSFALATLRQYQTHDGNLFTGKADLLNAETAMDWNNTLREGTVKKKAADALTKQQLKRLPDGVDRWLSLLSVESFLRKVYESTGKQLSEREMDTIRKTWLTEDLRPEVFLERLLTLTIKANRKLYNTYSNWENKNAMSLGSLLNDEDSFAVLRARAIIDNLHKTKKFNPRALSPLR